MGSRKEGVTQKTGYTFVASNMQPYSADEVDAKKIYELTENMYIVGLLHQLTNLVVQSDVSISVYDDKDNVVEDVSRKLNRMFSTGNCNISSVARSAFQDMVTWGMAIFNWVWEKKDGEIACTELTRLSPFTFSVQPSNTSHAITGRLLKGVYYDTENRTIHYCQSMGSQPIELSPADLFIVKDMAAASPDGTSLILPLAPVIQFLTYSWNALAQQMNRTGAPIMFIKVDNPVPSRIVNGQYVEGDIEYANRILKTWGKDTLFTLRENMTVNTIETKEGSLAISTINKGNESIRDFMSPAGLLGKDGTLIAGNSDATLRLINSDVHGWISLLTSHLRELPNYYLRVNKYPEEWHAEVTIATAAIEDRAQKLEEAKVLASTKAGAVNEIREIFGLEGVSKEELAKMNEEWGLLGV